MADYCKRLALSKIGFSFDPSKLSQFQASYLAEIHSQFEKIKVKEMKKARKGKGKGK